MSATDVKDAEDQAFLDWRVNLARLEEDEKVVLSPFERNVDFWRVFHWGVGIRDVNATCW